MKKLQMLVMSVVVSIFAIGCVHSQKVDKVRVDDDQLSCKELLDQIKEAEDYKKKAEGNKSVNGTNVAAAVFFLPALVSTYIDANDAIKAAEDRKQHLAEIYKGKSCKRVREAMK